MHELQNRLNEIITEKKTRLCLAADVNTSEELLNLAETLGPKLCILKTHTDCLEDFDAAASKTLRAIADKHSMLIFEDRKYGDIGHTMQRQLSCGLAPVGTFADIITANALPGPSLLSGVQAASENIGRPLGVLLLACMTPAGHLFTKEYALKAAELAKNNEVVLGVIASADSEELFEVIRSAVPEKIVATPGVRMAEGGDSLGQTYNTPEKARNLGADIIIVGRGILKAKDPLKAAEEYRAGKHGKYLTK